MKDLFKKKKAAKSSNEPNTDKAVKDKGVSNQSFLSRFKKTSKTQGKKSKMWTQSSGKDVSNEAGVTETVYDNYAIPTSAPKEPRFEGEYDASSWFSFTGRIGRVQYLAYQTLALICVMIAWGFIFLEATSASIIYSLLSFVFSCISLYLTIISYKRRFNDLGKTGWLTLAVFIPVVNFIAFIYLAAVKGNEGVNGYGLPPHPYSKLQLILAILFPILPIVMVVAVIYFISTINDALGTITNPNADMTFEQMAEADEQSITEGEITIDGDMTITDDTQDAVSDEAIEMPDAATDEVTNESTEAVAIDNAQSEAGESGSVDAETQAQIDAAIAAAIADSNKGSNNASGSGSSELTYEDFLREGDTKLYIDEGK